MVKVAKQNGNLAVVIPNHVVDTLGLSDGTNVEWEILSDKTAGIKVTGLLSEVELIVLEKLMGVKFAERTKQKVQSVLTDEEQKALERLITKKAVSFYEEGKYKDNGVYSISREYYGLQAKKKPQSDYMIISDQRTAYETMEQMKESVKKGEWMSVRGFDEKYYFVSREAFDRVGSKVVAALKQGDLELKDLPGVCDEGEGICKAVIEILKEAGDVFEKKKGLYSLA